MNGIKIWFDDRGTPRVFNEDDSEIGKERINKLDISFEPAYTSATITFVGVEIVAEQPKPKDKTQ